MNTDELVDFLLSQKDAKTLLKSFIQSAGEAYEKAKASENGVDGNPLAILALGALELGWSFIIENRHDDDYMEGIITGTPEYCERQMDSISGKKKAIDFVNWLQERGNISKGLMSASYDERSIEDMFDKFNNSLKAEQ